MEAKPQRSNLCETTLFLALAIVKPCSKYKKNSVYVVCVLCVELVCILDLYTLAICNRLHLSDLIQRLNFIFLLPLQLISEN